MRKTLITFGTLALFAVTPAFALDDMGTIDDFQDGPTSVGIDTRAGTELSVRMLPVLTSDQTETIAVDDMGTIDGGQDGATSIGTDAGS